MATLLNKQLLSTVWIASGVDCKVDCISLHFDYYVLHEPVFTFE